LADDKGFWFQSQAVKALCHQLKKNRSVEVCFHSPDTTSPGPVLRVSGEVEFVDDIALKAKILEERPFLKSKGIKNAEDPMLVVFRIYKGEAYFWRREDSMRESEIERIRF
jgi:pyridoxamine 5'-phosphate oxidase